MTLPVRMDPDEVDYFLDLMNNKPDGTQMVEWGSGGSTTMFLPFFRTGSFTSIEHNQEWFDKVSADLQTGEYDPACMANFTYAYIPPIADIRFYGYGVPYEENPCFARDYISPRIPSVDIWNADIFFVDGICRGPILATILRKAKKPVKNYDDTARKWNPPAAVYVHDYFGPEKRENWYDWASSLYSKVEKVGSTLARLTI